MTTQKPNPKMTQLILQELPEIVASPFDFLDRPKFYLDNGVNRAIVIYAIVGWILLGGLLKVLSKKLQQPKIFRLGIALLLLLAVFGLGRISQHHRQVKYDLEVNKRNQDGEAI